MRYGLKGILLIVGAFLPQYIFYVPAFWMLLNWGYHICCVMYFPARVYDEKEYPFRSRKNFWLRQGLQLMTIFLVVIIGIVLESYVNPIFLTKILKIF